MIQTPPGQVQPTSDSAAWDAEFGAAEAAALQDAVASLDLEPGDVDSSGDASQGQPPAASGAVVPAPKKADPTPEELAAILEASEKPEEAVVEAPAPDAGKATTALLQLLEKERAVTEAKSAVSAEREAFEAEKTAFYESQKNSDTIDAASLKRVLLTNPAQLLTALGVTPAQVSKLLIAHQLGDKAPPELQREIAAAQERAQVQELRDRLDRYEKQDGARAIATKVQADIAAYVTKGVSTNSPTVAAVAKVNPSKVQSEIFQEIAADANARAHREPNGKPLSVEAAIARVEKRWSDIAAAFKAPVTDPSKQATPSGAKTAPTAGLTTTGTPSIVPSKIAPSAPTTLISRTFEDEEKAALEEALASIKAYRRQSR